MLTRRVLRTGLFTAVVGLASGWDGAFAEERTQFPAAAQQRYDQGKDLQKKGKLSEAIQAFEEAMQQGMDAYPRVHLQRAASNFDLKNYDAAITQYTKFIEEFGLEDSCRY